MLFGTSPRLIASSSFFWVGSSVRSSSSGVSAMAHRRRKEWRNSPRSLDENAHHDAEGDEEDEHPDQDRRRQPEEEYLQLGHQPRKHAEAEIEQDREGDERRRDLHGKREAPRRRPDGEACRVAGRRKARRGQERVEIADRQRSPDGAGRRRRSARCPEASEDCRSTPAARPWRDRPTSQRPAPIAAQSMVPAVCRAPTTIRTASPMRSPIAISPMRIADRRGRRAALRQEHARQGKQHERKEKREGEARPRRDELLADPGHEHHHGSDPREGQHEGGGEVGNRKAHRRRPYGRSGAPGTPVIPRPQ